MTSLHKRLGNLHFTLSFILYLSLFNLQYIKENYKIYNITMIHIESKKIGY